MKSYTLYRGRAFMVLLYLLFVSCSPRNESNVKTVADDPDVPADTLLITSSKLPICIADTLFIENNRNPLVDTLVGKLLFAGADSVDVRNFWSNEFLDKESMADHLEVNDYYLLDTIVRTNNFLVILLQRQQEGSTEKFIITTTHTNRLIDRFRVAYHSRSGSYTMTDGGRAPFYKQNGSCINKDLTIETEEDGRYVIETTGRVMVIK